MNERKQKWFLFIFHCLEIGIFATAHIDHKIMWIVTRRDYFTVTMQKENSTVQMGDQFHVIYVNRHIEWQNNFRLWMCTAWCRPNVLFPWRSRCHHLPFRQIPFVPDRINHWNGFFYTEIVVRIGSAKCFPGADCYFVSRISFLDFSHRVADATRIEKCIEPFVPQSDCDNRVQLPNITVNYYCRRLSSSRQTLKTFHSTLMFLSFVCPNRDESKFPYDRLTFSMRTMW